MRASKDLEGSEIQVSEDRSQGQLLHTRVIGLPGVVQRPVLSPLILPPCHIWVRLSVEFGWDSQLCLFLVATCKEKVRSNSLAQYMGQYRALNWQASARHLWLKGSQMGTIM